MPKVSKNPNVNWKNNAIQFARFIAEAEAAGAFTEELIKEMCLSMDLTPLEIAEIIDRAQEEWDKIKDDTI